VHIVAGRIFAFAESENGAYIMVVVPRNFYASFAILCVYCVAIWIARPSKEARSCWPLHSIVDFISTCYQSDILNCPEFWVQSENDTEQHLKAQVTLANRRYQYGIYIGQDGENCIGIGVAKTPEAWVNSQGDKVKTLDCSVRLARDIFHYGMYGQDLDFGDMTNVDGGPMASNEISRVTPLKRKSWTGRAFRAIKPARRVPRRDTESGNKHGFFPKPRKDE